jgi:hypothetical protein
MHVSKNTTFRKSQCGNGNKVVNEIITIYNGYCKVLREYQSHSVVDVNTLFVTLF